MTAKANRLQREKSPYLLQHAHNPVDWHPWGAEAFTLARQQDKPLFVSIGYSTCHWCHVMERESFENDQVAALMNQAFINVKVDREERPDIDTVYMTACQLMNQQGGWPLNVLLTPEGEPFFSLTYIPRESVFGRMGMLDLVPRVRELWTTRRSELLDAAQNVTNALTQACNQTSPASGIELDAQLDIDAEILQKGYQEYVEHFDAQHGGFGQAPKFPTPNALLFLLSLRQRTNAPKALEMVEKTLQGLRLGGIFDHVGYGFHRYSTDTRWLLPHFEKMLYDQALLAMTYVACHQTTQNDFYGRVAEEIFTYVLRDLLSPEGAFYCAEDADSEGEEGRFYVFTLREVREALGEDAHLAADLFNCVAEGNFHDEATGAVTGKNIIHLSASLEEMAQRLRTPPDDLAQRLEHARRQLFALREKRPRPLLDDKILTDWNGLMIAALARGAQLPKGGRYLRHASRAADFILRNMSGAPLPADASGTRTLLHRYREGEAALPALQQDYAFFCWGLMEIYLAGGESRYLHTALELCDAMIELFWDAEKGGFFMTSPRLGDELICRPKDYYDGALPSGNAVAAMVLAKLGRLSGRKDLVDRAMHLRRSVRPLVKLHPGTHAFMLLATASA